LHHIQKNKLFFHCNILNLFIYKAFSSFSLVYDTEKGKFLPDCHTDLFPALLKEICSWEMPPGGKCAGARRFCEE
jgi:hypothetical protein